MPKPMPPEDKAILIESVVLQADIWFVFDPAYRFDTGGLACFYAHELPMLRHKSDSQLEDIHEAKLAFEGAQLTK